MKQIKTLKAKKTAAAAAAKTKKVKQLDEATMKEVGETVMHTQRLDLMTTIVCGVFQAMELQEQLNSFNRDLRSVRNALASAQREARMNSVTTNQIQVRRKERSV